MAWPEHLEVTRRQPADLPTAGDDAWIEVIHKMDQVYADLVQSQTELERQNARLQEAQAFIGSVLSAMSDVIIVCDLDGQVQQVNRALVDLVGRPEKSLLGRPLQELLDADATDAVKTLLSGVRDHGQVSDHEVNLRAADGHTAPLAVNGTARRDHKGRLVGLVLVGRPVGELRRAYRELDLAHHRLTETQQQLVVSEKMAALGRLVAGVAHELNNPISFVFGNMHALKRYGQAITSYLEACEAHSRDPDLEVLRRKLKIDQVLRDIGPLVEGTLEGAERVSDIVQDLRRFTSNQEEPVEPFDLSRLVRTASEWVIKTERSKPQVRYDMPDTLEILGRRGQIHQIIVNLVQNAVDVLAGRERASIEIVAAVTDTSAVIGVKDNGPGIAREHMSKLFEPFFTTKPIGQGTGLGLYVSYGIAQKLGGTLTAMNRPEGGAHFILTVPIHERTPK